VYQRLSTRYSSAYSSDSSIVLLLPQTDPYSIPKPTVIMPRPSLDSERPIMAQSVSSLTSPVLPSITAYPIDCLVDESAQLCSQTSSVNRMSIYSNSPSFTSSTSTESAAAMAEIKEFAQGLDRLKDSRLERQRYVASAQKTDDLSKLALGAKLDRALGRRMTAQDAVMRVKPRKPSIAMDEKAALADRPISGA
jgi:vancomycin resistance protein YoaR